VNREEYFGEDRFKMTRDKEIEEILVDTYDKHEEATSWEVTFQDEVSVPFEATLVGVPVTVLGFRATNNCTIQCQVRADKKERWIGVGDLDNEKLPDDMQHFLVLYRYWAGEEK
jgi:Calcium binding